jgi:hypothetical protein
MNKFYTTVAIVVLLQWAGIAAATYYLQQVLTGKPVFSIAAKAEGKRK